jgi:hypothetical protein
MYTTCEVADGEKVECTWLNKKGSGILLGRIRMNYILNAMSSYLHV